MKEAKPTSEKCYFNQYQPVDNTQNICKFQSSNFRQSDDGITKPGVVTVYFMVGLEFLQATRSGDWLCFRRKVEEERIFG
jgi:hypothetical protein